MLNLEKVQTNILGDTEVLDNIIRYIVEHVGSQDWDEHIENISGYIAAGIAWPENETKGYLHEVIKGENQK